MFTKEFRKCDVLHHIFPKFNGIKWCTNKINIKALLKLCDKVSQLKVLNINCHKNKSGEKYISCFTSGLGQLRFLNTLRIHYFCSYISHCAEIIDYFKEIRKLKQLTTLDIDYNLIANDIVNTVCHLKKLKHLVISSSDVTNVNLFNILNLQNLITLTLDCKSTIPIYITNQNIVNLQHCTHLSLIGCGLVNTSIVSLSQLYNLTHLNISHNNVTNKIVENINQLNNLIELNIGQTRMTGVSIDMLNIVGLKKLVAQGLRFNEQHVISLDGLVNLVSLDLSHSHLCDNNIKMITNNKARFSTSLLQELNFGHTNLTNNSMQYIKRLNHLTILDVSNTTITSKYIHVVKLTKLNMHGNQLNTIDVKRLLEIKTLQYLDIKCCNVGELKKDLHAHNLTYLSTTISIGPPYHHVCNDKCIRDLYRRTKHHHPRFNIFLNELCQIDTIWCWGHH